MDRAQGQPVLSRCMKLFVTAEHGVTEFRAVKSELLCFTGDIGYHDIDDICASQSGICASSGCPHTVLSGAGAHAFTQKRTIGADQISILHETVQHAHYNWGCVGSCGYSCN